MYAVIFKATVNAPTPEYHELARRMRDLARNRYGCAEFVSVTEGKQEIAISYWRSLEDIKKWKQDAEHLSAQALGRSQFYESYQVQIVEVLREYYSS